MTVEIETCEFDQLVNGSVITLEKYFETGEQSKHSTAVIVKACYCPGQDHYLELVDIVDDYKFCMFG